MTAPRVSDVGRRLGGCGAAVGLLLACALASCAWPRFGRRAPPPAWTALAPPRLVQLHAEFATAALPLLAASAQERPQGTLEGALPDGTRRRVRIAASGGGPEQVVDEKDGETFSAHDLDRDGRPDELLHRRHGSAVKVQDMNSDGHFERVLREEALPGGQLRVTEWRDEDGDGSFESERELPQLPEEGAADAGAL